MLSEATQPAARRFGRDHGLNQREPLRQPGKARLVAFKGVGPWGSLGTSLPGWMKHGDSSRCAWKGEARNGDKGSAAGSWIGHQFSRLALPGGMNHGLV